MPPRQPSFTLLLSRAPKPRAYPTALTHQQSRAATLIPRPHRPYTFTQLLTLSDGSTFTHRTTSPIAVYASTRDTRNAPLWNPSDSRLTDVEADEAGRLRAFRRRFGRGWDAQSTRATAQQQKKQQQDGQATAAEASLSTQKAEGEEEEAGIKANNEGVEMAEQPARDWNQDEEDNLLDLIGSYARDAEKDGKASGMRQGAPAGGKGGKAKR